MSIERSADAKFSEIISMILNDPVSNLKWNTICAFKLNSKTLVSWEKFNVFIFYLFFLSAALFLLHVNWFKREIEDKYIFRIFKLNSKYCTRTKIVCVLYTISTLIRKWLHKILKNKWFTHCVVQQTTLIHFTKLSKKWMFDAKLMKY